MTILFISTLTLSLLYSETYYHLRVNKTLEDETDNCYSCHTSIVLDKRDFMPVLLERGSVHYKNQKHCTDCHKGEGLLLRKRGSKRDDIFGSCPLYGSSSKDKNKINELCGGCHQKELEDLSSGVHRAKLYCTYCHSNHGIKKASLDIIRPERCSSCHKYPNIAPVKDEFRKAETILLAAESYLSKYRAEFPDIYEKYTSKINLAREQMRSQRHRLGRADISSNMNYILLLSGHIRKEINREIENQRVKRIITGGITLIILLAITGLLYYVYQYVKWRRTLNKE